MLQEDRDTGWSGELVTTNKRDVLHSKHTCEGQAMSTQSANVFKQHATLPVATAVCISHAHAMRGAASACARLYMQKARPALALKDVLGVMLTALNLPMCSVSA